MDDRSSHTIRGYTLHERIGQGGFGAVYRAHQKIGTLEREVAIKVILPKYANHPDFIRRFETEAQIIARLEHSFIVPLYDYWREPDGAYLVMRYLRGGSLHSRLRRGPLPPRDAVRVVDQIAAALTIAHRNNVVHRDLKPANILLDGDGNALLADFGIAKSITVERGLTSEGTAIGDPYYMAPEQIHLEDVTPATDIYTLGIILYEILTGEHPFPPNLLTTEALHRQMHDPLPDVTAQYPELLPEVDAVIQAATAKDPAQRTPDVLAVASAFRKAFGEMLTAAPGVATSAKQHAPVDYDATPTVTPVDQAEDTPTEIKQPVTITPVRELVTLRNPYKGLRPFEEADAADFFGRDALVDRLLARLGADDPLARFLAVVGPSGSGKSSVVKAGLVPALRDGALPGSESWFIAEFTPGDEPLQQLENALLSVAVHRPSSLKDQLRADPRALIWVADNIFAGEEGDLLLVIDQFEELFAAGADEDTRNHFLDLIFTAISDPNSRVRVIITLRADFTDRPLQYPDFGELIRQRTEFVLALTPDELEQAIREPARLVGAKLEPELLAAIIADVRDEPGALPMLQYALYEIFEARDNYTMTLDAYRELGGVLGALARRAEAVFTGLTAERRTVARQVFLRLITLGEGVEDTRRRVRQSELAAVVVDDHLLQTTLDAFGRSRLLTFDRDPTTREPTVEVAHEALIREWARLREWLDESRDDIRMQRKLAAAVQDWQEAGQDTGYLLRGSRLEQFAGWVADTDLALSEDEYTFLDKSIDEKNRQQARWRRLRNLAAALITVVALVMTALALWANSQRSHADDQKERAEIAEHEALRQASIGLAALAEKELEGSNPERGVLLALEALEEYPYTTQAQAALVHAVDSYRTVEVLEVSGDYDFNENFYEAKWSPDGSRVVASGPSSPNSILMWDVASGAVLLSLDKHRDLCAGDHTVHELAWSPSGDRVASYAQGPDSSPCGIVIWDSTTGDTVLEITDLESEALSIDWSADADVLLTGNEDGSATLWNVENGAQVIQLVGHTGSVEEARFSPDGSQIATVSIDGTIRLWDAATGDELQVLTGHVGGVYTLAWSPDSTRLLTAGDDGLPRVWDVTSGEILFVLKGHLGRVNSVDWSLDGRFLATVSTFETVEKIWDATQGRPLLEIKGASLEFGDFSPDSSRVLTGQFREFSRLFIWDVSLPTARLIGHANGQEYAAWSPDGSMIVTLGDDYTARVWDSASGAQLTILQDINPRFGDWSPDSTKVVIPDSETYEFYIWDIASNEIVQTIKPPEGHMPVFANWSPDGTAIAGGLWQQEGGKPIYIWDAETLDVLSILQPDNDCMQPWPEWSPDGTKIVSACILVEVGRNTPARIRDAFTGEELMSLESDHGWTYHAMWSPDGKRLLTTYTQGFAKIWDVETGEVLQTFAGHFETVEGADWSPDGTYVVTGDTNGVVKVWHSVTGEEITSFTVQGDALNTKWSPDGTHIIVAGGGLAEPVIKRVWLSTDELVAHAYDCCVTRELTAEERAQFGLPVREE